MTRYTVVDNDRHHAYVECPTCKAVLTEKGMGKHAMRHRAGFVPTTQETPTQQQIHQWPWQHLTKREV